MGKFLSLLIIKGIEYEGIMKSGSFCGLKNILCVGSKFIDKARWQVYKANSYRGKFLSLLIIKGIEYEGIMKSGSFCGLKNILCVGSKFIEKASPRRG